MKNAIGTVQKTVKANLQSKNPRSMVITDIEIPLEIN